MPEFDKNAGFIWAIFAIGIAVPVLLALFASARASLSKQRLERLKKDESSD